MTGLELGRVNECPSLHVLQQFAVGKSDDHSVAIETHLKECLACAAKLDEMECQRDSLIDRLRQHIDDTTGVQLDSQIATASDPTPTSAPDLFTGRYHVGELIAEGGMGQIHRALDTLFNRQVAVKRLLPKYRRDPEATERFRKEAAMTAGLQHPAIPPIHDLGTLSNGEPFLVMKLITGRTLAELLKERTNPRKDLQKFLSIFEQVAHAVGYAHAQGVIHRDIKPANVMVGTFGEVQVMDWGLAKKTGTAETPPLSARDVPREGLIDPQERTMDGAILGTTAYMAPEQARGEVSRLDARADVFALGAILFEILTGTSLYGEYPKRDILSIAQQGTYATALERLQASEVDVELADLTARCLSFQPGSRPIDGCAVGKAIANHAATIEDRLRTVEDRLQKVEVDRASTVATAKEPVKRRRLALFGGVVIASLLAIGLIASTRFGQQIRDFVIHSREHDFALRQPAGDPASSGPENIETLGETDLNQVDRILESYDIETLTSVLNQAHSQLGVDWVARAIEKQPGGRMFAVLERMDSEVAREILLHGTDADLKRLAQDSGYLKTWLPCAVRLGRPMGGEPMLVADIITYWPFQNGVILYDGDNAKFAAIDGPATYLRHLASNAGYRNAWLPNAATLGTPIGEEHPLAAGMVRYWQFQHGFILHNTRNGIYVADPIDVVYETWMSNKSRDDVARLLKTYTASDRINALKGNYARLGANWLEEMLRALSWDARIDVLQQMDMQQVGDILAVTDQANFHVFNLLASERGGATWAGKALLTQPWRRVFDTLGATEGPIVGRILKGYDDETLVIVLGQAYTYKGPAWIAAVLTTQPADWRLAALQRLDSGMARSILLAGEEEDLKRLAQHPGYVKAWLPHAARLGMPIGGERLLVANNNGYWQFENGSIVYNNASGTFTVADGSGDGKPVDALASDALSESH